jgi:hypothetical protein
MSSNSLVAGYRYCGNKFDGLVHDLARQTEDCNLAAFTSSNRIVKFERLDSALYCGYEPCRFCMKQEEND